MNNNNNKMTPKQLIVAVEGTVSVAPFWQTILSDYLHKIIRCFCDHVSINSLAELSLVVFNSHGSYRGACLVQRSGWTKDMDTFFQWLSAIPFSGGGFGDVAVAEGLAEALMMFSCPNGSQNSIMGRQKHCILVAASSPNSVSTQSYNPDIVESQPDNHLPSAETLAKSFAECGISLSVICPKELLKLESIYRAGKQNPRAADLHVDNVKNPHFLVLLSEFFLEGRAALSCSASGGIATITPKLNSIDLDVTTSTRPIPSGTGSNQNMMSRHCSDSSSSVTRMPSNQQSSNVLKSKKPDYSKVWEGRLCGKRRGQPVFITRLEGYTKISASVNLTENFPAMMVIYRLVSVDSVRQNFGKPLLFLFRALTLHGFLDQLQERKLCAVIQLPSQRLLLTVSNKTYRLFGFLLPQDIGVTPNPPIPDWQQLQAQLLELQAQEQHLQAQVQDLQAQYIQGQLLAQEQLQAQQEQLSMQRQQLEALWQQLQSQQQLQQCLPIKQE